ncbi:uncharacterized protein J4E79_003476 [Alternaria viburni]|uniref:uncharacterized protein n=1 Tax=Alternaria viburni TaxID=566460 RepID=UPI0020C3DEC8|nr:uncharacterized protein J4E79_003476 [Alternaria viburni]KAI4663976.1 hypothetical protein J4E79_003476 [Alternaria viburni]
MAKPASLHEELEKDASPSASGGHEYADSEENYKPKTLKFWLVIISIYLAFFLVALDRMIIATAIPAITNTYGTIADIGWYGSGYMLTCAIFNPLFGKIYQLYDTKWTFLVSVFLFEVGSALTLTWRWCFYINLPIGALTFACIFFFLDLPSTPKEKLSILAQLKRLDPIGLLFFVPSMVCLILALQWGGTTDPWSAPKIVGLLVTFAVTFIAFLVVEFTMPDTAMAPPRVILNRSMGGAMLFIFLLAGGMMNTVYYIAIWFQAAQGQSAMQAGVRTIPLCTSLIVAGIITAVITQKIGYYVPAMLLSAVVASIASGLLSTLTPESSAREWIGYQVFYGCGLGFGAQTANLVPQTILPRSDVSLGMAMVFFLNQQGGAIFLAVGQNLFSTQLVKQLSGNSKLDTELIINTGATDLRKVVAANEIDTVVSAYSYSITRTFLLAAALSACTIIGALMVEWRSIKERSGKPAKQASKDVEKEAA